jgi:ribonucleotide monophosphatase NagD (HAD superfamily)
MGQPYPMTLLGKPTSPTYKHAAHMIQVQAKKLGLAIGPRRMYVVKKSLR